MVFWKMRFRRAEEASWLIELGYSGILFNEISLLLLPSSYIRVYSRHRQQGCNMHMKKAKKGQVLTKKLHRSFSTVFMNKGCKYWKQCRSRIYPYTVVVLSCTVCKFKIPATYLLTMCFTYLLTMCYKNLTFRV